MHDYLAILDPHTRSRAEKRIREVKKDFIKCPCDYHQRRAEEISGEDADWNVRDAAEPRETKSFEPELSDEEYANLEMY